jgi:hypothetical protein
MARLVFSSFLFFFLTIFIKPSLWPSFSRVESGGQLSLFRCLRSQHHPGPLGTAL